jgi:D-apiose dehydrogenase
MSKSIKIAVVGCGYFAQNHLQAWKALKSSGANLVAVCDVDPAKAQIAAQRFGAKAYSNLDEMLNFEAVDLVDVVTQMGSHLEISTTLSHRKIPTILQKPLAPDWKSCCAIADIALAHKNFVAVHENFRFQASVLRLKELLDQDAIGTPTWARLSFRTGHDVYQNQPYFYTEDRLAILDVGIHVLDLARVLVGEVAHLSCETQRRNPKVKAEDTATLLLSHESGAVSVVECTYEARRLPDLFPTTRIEIEGPKGSLILNTDDELFITQGGKLRVETIDNPVDDWMERPFQVLQRGVIETNRSILLALQNGHFAPTDISDNLKTFALVEAAYASAISKTAQRPAIWKPRVAV